MTHTTQQEARRATGLFSYPSLAAIGAALLDLVFPPRCVHCGRVDFAFCDVCLQAVKHLPEHTHIQSIDPEFIVASSGKHEALLQSAVQALKYHGVRDLAQPLGLRLATIAQQADWMFDILVPVPLHMTRLQQRGYNQAHELAEVLASAVQKPCVPDALERTRATQSQVGLSRDERLTNLQDAFAANEDTVRGKTLLLVDDVLTTGSTLRACATVALEAGAAGVYGITVTAAQHSFPTA